MHYNSQVRNGQEEKRTKLKKRHLLGFLLSLTLPILSNSKGLVLTMMRLQRKGAIPWWLISNLSTTLCAIGNLRHVMFRVLTMLSTVKRRGCHSLGDYKEL